MLAAGIGTNDSDRSGHSVLSLEINSRSRRCGTQPSGSHHGRTYSTYLRPGGLVLSGLLHHGDWSFLWTVPRPRLLDHATKAEAGQFHVFTSDLALAEQLGTGKIKGLPRNEPDGQPVEVTMIFDEQGRLSIRAKYVPRNQEMEMTLDIPGGLREEEVQEHRRFLEETGFFNPSSAQQIIEAIDDDEDTDDIPLLEPID